jgi:hypothetical protein
VKIDHTPAERVPVTSPLVLVRTDDLWNAWQAAEIESGVALCDWATASDGRKADAYERYRDALDREETAAARVAVRLSGLA